MIALALAQAVAGDRRRADHGTRRRHAGAGAPTARAAARGARARADPDLPRHGSARRDLRPDRGHVRGQGSSRWAGWTRSSAAAASLYEAAARLAPGDRAERGIAPTIAGSPPDPGDPPSGCRFHPRCPYRAERCDVDPPLREIAPAHLSACHYAPWTQWPEVEVPTVTAEEVGSVSPEATGAGGALMHARRPRRVREPAQRLQGPRRRHARLAPGRDPRGRGRIGVREVDARAGDARPPGDQPRRGSSRGEAVSGRGDKRSSPPADPDDLPGPLPDLNPRQRVSAIVTELPASRACRSRSTPSSCAGR